MGATAERTTQRPVPGLLSQGRFPQKIQRRGCSAADELNGRPRKKLLGHYTLEGLFDAFLDAVFAV